MTKEAIIALANAFLLEKYGPDPYIVQGRRSDVQLWSCGKQNDTWWYVMYRFFMPDEPETVIDGDLTVLVNPNTGECAFERDVW
jgi:hypothetical protein